MIFFVLTFFVNCSPQRRLNRIVKKHPELSTTTIERDTVKIPEIQQVTEFKIVRDSEAFDSLLNEYSSIKALMNTSTLSAELLVIEYRDRLERIKRGVVKAVIPDTTFTIDIYRKITINGDSSFVSRGEVIISLSGAGVTHTLGMPPLNIPYDKKIVNIDATIGKPFYKDVWFWLFLAALVAVYLLIRK